MLLSNAKSPLNISDNETFVHDFVGLNRGDLSTARMKVETSKLANGNDALFCSNTVLGDCAYFSSEVFLMDCIQGMKEYPDKYFDLAVVDPPYRDKNSPTKEMRAKTNGSMKHFGEKPDEYFFMELFRISKNQIVFGANNFFKLLPNTSCFIFWDKVQVMENYADGELAWTSFDCPAKQFRYVWSGNRFGYPDNIQGVGKPTNRTHPTEKPIAIYDWIFSKFATEGMKVLDTHLGSGSSRIAAHKNKLNFVGFEIDEEYFIKSEQRYADFTSQLRLF